MNVTIREISFVSSTRLSLCSRLLRAWSNREAYTALVRQTRTKIYRRGPVIDPYATLLLVSLVIGTFMSQSITFLVAVPPMLWIPHQLVGAPLDHSVTLECYTEAHPTSLNYWTREDGLMIQGSNKYKTTSTPEKPSYKTHMTLTIHDLQVRFHL